MMKNWSKINENYFDNNRLNKYKNYKFHEFDRELRLLNLELLEKIELNFKKYLIKFFDENWWIKNKELYIPKYLQFILNFIKDKEENFKNYDNEVRKDLLLNNEILVFLFIEKLTFWEVNKLYRALNTKYKKNITINYWINVFIFSSWIYSLKYLRNLCSHSENLFNRKMVYSLEWREILNIFWVSNSYISYFLVLSLLEKNILNDNLWQKKVLNLLENNKISISEISLNKKMAPPVSMNSEAWEALVNTLYKKLVKKSNKKTKKINIILALDSKNGLWKDWDLAWRIKEDMKYFKDITTNNPSTLQVYPFNTKERQGKNAVIMWRKTWDSIPEKYRPLPDRINCILSRTYPQPLPDKEGRIMFFSSLENAINNLEQDKNIWEIFIIWWAQIYNLALQNKNLWKIYLTRVKWDFECDVFVGFKEEEFELIENSDWKQTKKWIEFRFEIYKRK